MIHGPDCGSKTFPTRCQFCRASVFYFSCDCGSKVFFDDLGEPWPIHDCLTRPGVADNRPSSLMSIPGISLYRGVNGSPGLLPGLVHTPRDFDPATARSLRESQILARDTVRMDPLGSIPIEITGVVRDRTNPNLSRRLGIEEGTIGYDLLIKQIGSGALVQLTILVDDLGQDPAAVDLQSYTIICKLETVSPKAVAGVIVTARMYQVQVLGSSPFWYSEGVELII